MKRLLPAVAVALALSPLAAQADVQTVFPDGYVVLSAEELAPRAGAVHEWEIRKHFPKGSFVNGAALTPEDRTPIAGARSAAELIAAFPQPSFQEYIPLVEGTDAAQYAGRINNRAY